MDLGEIFTEFVSDIVSALPAIIAALLVVIIGYIVGKFLGSSVNKVIEKTLSANLSHFKQIDLVIPVAIHASKLKQRGFNQSEMIAKTVSRLINAPLSHSNLIKTKNTPPQMRLTKENRLYNLKGSFRVTNTVEVKGKTILLVDDVITTGATFNACVAELVGAGAKEVYGFTLTRAL